MSYNDALHIMAGRAGRMGGGGGVSHSGHIGKGGGEGDYFDRGRERSDQRSRYGVAGGGGGGHHGHHGHHGRHGHHGHGGGRGRGGRDFGWGGGPWGFYNDYPGVLVTETPSDEFSCEDGGVVLFTPGGRRRCPGDPGYQDLLQAYMRRVHKT